MSNTKTKTVTWPYAVKTIGIGGMPASSTCPYDYTDFNTLATTASEIALEIFPPLYIYKSIGLYMHINYTFSSVVNTVDQVLQGVYVRDTPSSHVGAFGSTVENYMPLNIQADINRNIDVSLDLTSIMTGKPTNVVFLRFNRNVAASIRSGGSTNGDSISVWKLDLVYQTIGIRNEK